MRKSLPWRDNAPSGDALICSASPPSRKTLPCCARSSSRRPRGLGFLRFPLQVAFLHEPVYLSCGDVGQQPHDSRHDYLKHHTLVVLRIKQMPFLPPPPEPQQLAARKLLGSNFFSRTSMIFLLVALAMSSSLLIFVACMKRSSSSLSKKLSPSDM